MPELIGTDRPTHISDEYLKKSMNIADYSNVYRVVGRPALSSGTGLAAAIVTGNGHAGAMS